jgi:hypothetical protein
MGNKSVVVNYKEHAIFTRNDDPDVGYVQFTKSGDQVFIVVDGKPVGIVPADEFARVQMMFAPDPSREIEAREAINVARERAIATGRPLGE